MGCTEPPRPVSKSGSHGCVELGCRMRRGRRSENGRDCIRQWTTRKLRTDWTDGSGTSGKIGRWRAENQMSQPLNGQSVGRPPRAGLKGPTSESFRARRVMKYILWSFAGCLVLTSTVCAAEERLPKVDDKPGATVESSKGSEDCSKQVWPHFSPACFAQRSRGLA